MPRNDPELEATLRQLQAVRTRMAQLGLILARMRRGHLDEAVLLVNQVIISMQKEAAQTQQRVDRLQKRAGDENPKDR